MSSLKQTVMEASPPSDRLKRYKLAPPFKTSVLHLALMMALAIAASMFFAPQGRAQVPVTFTGTPSGAISPTVYDPIHDKWESGLPTGYREGDTAAISVRLAANSLDEGTTYKIEFCIQNVESPNLYAFVDFNLWDASKNPSTLPGSGSSTIPYGDALLSYSGTCVEGINVGVLFEDPTIRTTDISGKQ